jgi:hypothetical protein
LLLRHEKRFYCAHRLGIVRLEAVAQALT